VRWRGAEINVFEAALGKTKKLGEFLRRDLKSVQARDDSGMTPLHWASQNGHKETVRLPMARGASAFAEDRNGIAPCFLAREFKHPEIAELMRCP